MDNDSFSYYNAEEIFFQVLLRHFAEKTAKKMG